MTDCAKSGDCCDPVYLTGGMVERMVTATPDTAPKITREAAWLRKHWHFIAYVALPESKGATFRCDKFDPIARLCTAHDDRPSVCRGYPWYGKTPTALDTTMGARCSFVADVPGRLLPIVAVT